MNSKNVHDLYKNEHFSNFSKHFFLILANNFYEHFLILMYNFSYSINIFWIWWTSIQELFWKMTNTFLIQWTLFEFDENFLKTVKNNNLMNICLVRWANLNCDEHFVNLMNQKLSSMNIICILEHFLHGWTFFEFDELKNVHESYECLSILNNYVKMLYLMNKFWIQWTFFEFNEEKLYSRIIS